MQESKSRELLKGVLRTQDEFLCRVGGYVQRTGGKQSFYENRMACFSSDLMWENLDAGRQCRCCGQMLVSAGGGGGVKLMCCGVCKMVHYCDRACQKRDWKQVHKSVCGVSSETKPLQEAMHTCIRALSLMTLCAGREYAPTRVKSTAGALGECFSFDEDATCDVDDAAGIYTMRVDPVNNAVCNHFRRTKESGRVLFPIWDTAADNLVFVPISPDFMKNALGFDDTFTEHCRTCTENNDNVYFLLLCGKQGCAGANTWVSVPGTRRKLCQKARGATKLGAK